MAFGDRKGTLTGNGNSIGTSNSIAGSVVVAVGDLVVAVFGQQTNLTATGASDNLGNSYSAQNAGTDAGVVTGRVFYSRVTVAGTLTSVAVAASSSTNDWCGFAAVYTGPFASPPLDANPANSTADVTSPFTCPATGTLAQGTELVVCWGAANQSTVWAATSPLLLDGNANNSTNVKVALGSKAVTSTTTTSPEFTAAANPTADVLGTMSFKADTTASTTENSTATEAPSAGTTLPVTGAESSTATEAPSAGTTLPVSGAENATAIGTQDAGLLFDVAAAEAASGTDAPSAATTWAVTAAEAAGGADAPEATTTWAVATAEAAGGVDAPDAATMFAVAASEGADGADSPSAATLIPSSAAESAAAADAPDATIEWVVAAAETAGAVDDPSALAIFAASAIEGSTATDGPDGDVVPAGGGTVHEVSIGEAAAAIDGPDALVVAASTGGTVTWYTGGLRAPKRRPALQLPADMTEVALGIAVTDAEVIADPDRLLLLLAA